MSKLAIDMTLRAVEHVTRPFRRIAKHSDTLKKQFKATRIELKQLEKTQSVVEQFKSLTQKSESLNTAFNAQESALSKLKAKLKQSDKQLQSHRNTVKEGRSSVNQLTKSLHAQQEQLLALKRQGNASKDSIQSLKNAIDSSRLSLRQARHHLSEHTRALRDSERAHKQLANSEKKAGLESKKLGIAFNKSDNQLKKLQSSLKSAGFDVRNLAASETALHNKLDKTNSQLEKQENQLNKVAGRMQRLKRITQQYQALQQLRGQMASTGTTATAAGGGTLYAMSRGANAGISFDEQMSTVGALARIKKTSEEFKQLRALAKTLGSTTRFSATEAAGGMEFLAMSGFKAKEIVAAMPNMLALAAAGKTDLATTADIASNILTGFGLKARDMAMVSDVLAGTFTRSNVSLQMLGETMSYVAPVAKGLGISVQEASAMAGLLGNVGIQASMAGTSLRSIFNRLSAPPKMAKDALAELGIRAKTEAGKLRAIPEILAEVAQKTEKMGNAKRMGLFVKIAGTNAGSAMAELVEKGGAKEITKFVKILHKAHDNREALTIAQKMSDNIAGDIRSMSSAFEGLMITLTEGNNGALRQFIQSITGVIRNVMSWVKENPALAATAIKVAAAVAGLSVTFGLLSLTLSGLVGTFAVLRVAFAVLSRTFLLNPIGLAVTGIATAALLIHQYWEPIKGFFSRLWSSISDIFDGAIGRVSKRIINWSPVGLFYKAFASVFSFFDVDMPRRFTEFGSNLINGLIKGITNKLGDVQSAISGVANSTISWFKDKLGIASPSRVFIQQGQHISDGIGIGIHNNARHATQAVATLSDRLKKVVPTALAVGLSVPATASDAGSNLPTANNRTQTVGGPITTRHVTVNNSQPIVIHAHAAPGMDEQELARMIAIEVEKRLAEKDRNLSARRRTRFYDNED